MTTLPSSQCPLTSKARPIRRPEHHMAAHRVRIGCSGWSYDDWRGGLYPDGLPKRRWLERYAEVFDTVEVNATF